MFIRAELESLFSTCRRLQTGAVIFDNFWGITSTGYNGAPKNQTHCNEIPETEGRCQICIHAERNAGNTAARQGKSTNSHSIVVLHRPCVACANDIIQYGLGAIYYRHAYDTDGMGEYVHTMMVKEGVYIAQVPPTIWESKFSRVIKELRNGYL